MILIEKITKDQNIDHKQTTIYLRFKVRKKYLIFKKKTQVDQQYS